MSDEEIRLLLLDDHTSFRELLALRLASEPGLTVVAEAGSLAEARQRLRQIEIDVALVDLDLPDGSGVELIRALRAKNPQAQVLVLTASGSRHEHAAAVAAGASGVLHKAVGSAEIIAAIRRLCAGETLLSPREAVELFHLADQRREAERATHRLVAQLTPRERDLLQLLAEGLNDAAIAERLYVGPKTVRNQMVALLAKLGVDSRLQALVLAVRHNLVTFGETHAPQ
jgi:DNA-binding NarL/FixJ family response regulator